MLASTEHEILTAYKNLNAEKKFFFALELSDFVFILLINV